MEVDKGVGIWKIMGVNVAKGVVELEESYRTEKIVK